MSLPSEARAAARRSLGLVLIFVTAAIWIVSSFLSESLVTATDTEKEAVHPVLLTYLATSLFTLYLPLLRLQAWVAELMRRRSEKSREQGEEGSDADTHSKRADQEQASSSSSMPMHAAAWAMPIWFCAQLTFNMSLARTSVTSNTILSSTSSLFTFFLSMWLLSETFSVQKLMAIVACIAGTVLVTLSDSTSDTSGHASFWGDVLAVMSACLYGGYTVVMRKKMPGEEAEEHVAMFFGYLGLFSTVLLSPVILLCLFLGVFSLSTIPKEAYFIIILEGLLDYVLSDYLWARAVMLLGPTVATLGLSVQIPMAAVAEFLLGKAKWIETYQSLLMTLGGTALILFGFFGINLFGSQEPKSATDTSSLEKKTSGQGADEEELQGLLREAGEAEKSS